ncbi:MAG: membrane protein insertase YidC [Dactylosporangium sp.]|nr:membrane protein insertase YidC [Dactylosporangium sp.]NNJ61063.1 membrane protein insertase YidC [Dactylosporangium sp.]
MAGLYWTISQILLFWHGLWDKVLPDKAILGTNWQWILAIVFLVITIRVVLFPIFVKQIKSQRAMQAIQPKMKELQDKHKGDRETMQKELMELYRKEKVNPLMGCLPMFLQVPVFLSLFHVLRWISGRDKPMLYGWTKPLYDSAADARLFGVPIPAKFSSSAAELTLLGANGLTVKIVAATLVLIMMLTTFLTSRQMILKTGWSAEPQQRMIQKLMLYGIPVSLLISGGLFPLGVIIYWVINNLVSLGQQAWVLHKYPPPPNALKTTKPAAGGAKKTRPAAGGAKKAVSGRANGKVTGKPSVGKAGTTPAIERRAAAPKPGAKPVNPKKSGPSKR